MALDILLVHLTFLVPVIDSPIDLNLPIAGLTIALVLLLLKPPTPPGTIKEKLAKMDWM